MYDLIIFSWYFWCWRFQSQSRKGSSLARSLEGGSAPGIWWQILLIGRKAIEDVCRNGKRINIYDKGNGEGKGIGESR
jgi:hypothetical protein